MNGGRDRADNRNMYFVTGANGFVGRALTNTLASMGNSVVAAERENTYPRPVRPDVEVYSISDLSDCVISIDLMANVHTVISCAARAHVMKDEAEEPLIVYRNVNTVGTLNLARQAATAGVKRFIFISSIKVNGEQTLLNQPFVADAIPAPEDAYGISKMEAEQGLR